jgi:uncharacterized protein (UPF0548 family)
MKAAERDRPRPPQGGSLAPPACATGWRVLHGFERQVLEARLGELATCERSVPDATPAELVAQGYRRHASQATIGREAPGCPVADGAFERAREAVADYRFSDPRIVAGHFDRHVPLLGRRMLLEIQVLGLRFLCGVIVGRVVMRTEPDHTTFAFRYDTLAGHIERGREWFVLRKDHASGDVSFRIDALWRAGELPAWWIRLGFALLSGYYRAEWSRRAHLRLREIVGTRDPKLPPVPHRRRLMQAHLPAGEPL